MTVQSFFFNNCLKICIRDQKSWFSALECQFGFLLSDSINFKFLVVPACNTSEVFQIGLFTRLEGLAWSQHGFWQPSFCRKLNLWSLCCSGKTMVVSLHYLNGERGKCRQVDYLSFQASLHPGKQFREAPPQLPYQNKGFMNHSFCKKLICQSPYWDQARFSSLVKKQVESDPNVLFSFFYTMLLLHRLRDSVSPLCRLVCNPSLQWDTMRCTEW